MLGRERMVDPFVNETFLEKKEQKGSYYRRLFERFV